MKWLENGVKVNAKKTRMPRGTNWVTKQEQKDQQPKIQCYDPPDVIAVCLNCPLPYCDAPEHNGSKSAKCPLSGKKPAMRRGYCV